MKTIKTNISGVDVLIQVEDDGAANDDFLGAVKIYKSGRLLGKISPLRNNRRN